MSFGAPHSYLAGLTPAKVLAADLRGNGMTDLITRNAEDGSISVLLGNGNGTFQYPIIRQFGSSGDVAVGNFNGDGIPDLAVGRDEHSVSILFGNGDGTFQKPVTVETGIRPYVVATGHFQSGKTDDLVVINSGSAYQISVILSQGDGTFGAPTPIDVGSAAVTLAVGDLRGTGVQDLVVAGEDLRGGPGILSVLLGNGDGTFQRPALYRIGSEFPRSVAIGDFLGTGVPDVVVGGKFANGVDLLLGNGDGTFQDATEIVTPDHPYSVATGDLDGRGAASFATWNVDDLGHYTTIDIYRSNWDGSFNRVQSLPLPPEGRISVIEQGLLADLRRFGFVDLVTPDPERGTVVVWLNSGFSPDAHDRAAAGDATSSEIERTSAQVSGAIVAGETTRFLDPASGPGRVHVIGGQVGRAFAVVVPREVDLATHPQENAHRPGEIHRVIKRVRGWVIGGAVQVDVGPDDKLDVIVVP